MVKTSLSMENMKKIKVKQNQSIMDVAIENYGILEGMSDLIFNNQNLKNDPKALSRLGIDSLYNVDFYIDVAVLPQSEISVNNNSLFIKQMTIKELKGVEITTYENN